MFPLSVSEAHADEAEREDEKMNNPSSDDLAAREQTASRLEPENIANCLKHGPFYSGLAACPYCGADKEWEALK